MYKVGLTGGIGCGKSTVSDLFKQYSIPVIDADEISHALVTPNSSALQKISTYFGQDCLTASGHLNRSHLREIIFNNALKKTQLEAIMHPLIFAEIDKQVQQSNASYCIISIPLLIETNMQSSVDHILVVDCPETEQIKRVQLRDELTTSQVQAIIRSQVSREQRIAEANSIIDNQLNNDQLVQQVHDLHLKFMEEAA